MFRPTEEYKKCVLGWRDAAIADGWSIKPSYKHEDVSRASTLEREGFKAQLLTREPQPKTDYLTECRNAQYELNIWGPDGMALEYAYPYSWQELNDCLLLCMECKQGVDKVRRVGFAGRVCDACYPKAKARDEKLGWCD